MPMGTLEPFVCPAGSYCPPPGIEVLNCTSGHFCPLGSWKPTPCKWPAMYCGTNSQKDTQVLALILVLLADTIVLLGVILQKLFQWRRARQGKKAKGIRKEATRWALRKTHTYSKLGKPPARSREVSQERGVRGGNMEEHQISEPEFSSRITSVRRVRTGFDVLMSEDFPLEYAFAMGAEKEGSQTTDLQQFVQSMSRCLGATKFGLSFEFENLSFQPKGSPKMILDQVSGCINSGSLWGVMGASGAGKCEHSSCV